MFRFSSGGRDFERGCGPRGGRRREFDPERFFYWVERLNAGQHGRGGPRGRRRMFDGGELRLVLLKLIADEPRHGYDLIKAIEELTGGAYAPSPGVVYPTVAMLDDIGFIAERESEGAKKLFEATDAGRTHLAENAEQVAALMTRLESVGEHRNRTDKAPIRRSMGNLRVALQDRLSKGEFSDETLHEIATLIDEVAQRIERLK